MLGVGAVEFPKQRRDDLWEVGLDPVHSKVHSYCTKKLKDAGSLKEEIYLNCLGSTLSHTKCSAESRAHSFFQTDIVAILGSKYNVPRIQKSHR